METLKKQLPYVLRRISYFCKLLQEHMYLLRSRERKKSNLRKGQ